MKSLLLTSKLLYSLILFAFFIAYSDSDLLLIRAIIVALLSSSFFDALCHYVKTKKCHVTTNSLITGIIIGFVLSSDTSWWMSIVVCACAMLSKHYIRYRNRPIFNPAAFGMLMGLLFLKQYTQWAGAYNWYILIPFGLYVTYKMKKLPIVISYAITYLGLFFIHSFLQKGSFLNVMLYANYFFIFIMLIEPKTSPTHYPDNYIFGISVALIVFILYKVSYRYDAELTALLLLNMMIPVTTKLQLKKRKN